jgi:hypothetical protein
MCTGAKTPEGRAQIAAAQTRRWEAYRERMGLTKPAKEKAQDLSIDDLVKLVLDPMPAQAKEDRTLEWLRKMIESTGGGRRNPEPAPEQKPVAVPERPVTAPAAERKLEFLSVKSELRRYQTSPYISKPPRPTRADVSPAAARRMRGRS